uniref:Uncharacterized protein n=1 Tax=Anguilla anguilla TaxID=7936 RepID=A0A0E9VV71_ANGAN
MWGNTFTYCRLSIFVTSPSHRVLRCG